MICPFPVRFFVGLKFSALRSGWTWNENPDCLRAAVGAFNWKQVDQYTTTCSSECMFRNLLTAFHCFLILISPSMPQLAPLHSQPKLVPLYCSNNMVQNDIITPVVNFLKRYLYRTAIRIFIWDMLCFLENICSFGEYSSIQSVKKKKKIQFVHVSLLL